MDLLPCIQLELLQITQTNDSNVKSVLKPGDEIFSLPEVQAGNFLPNLKMMFSGICLGKKSRLFEEKNSLTTLELHCSHIGTNASDFNWNDVPKFWVNLQELSISFTTGLRMDMLRQLILRLKNLQQLHLPSKLRHSTEDKILCPQLKHEFLNAPSSLDLKFNADWIKMTPRINSRTNLYDNYDSDDSTKVASDRRGGKCEPMTCSCPFQIPIQ